MERLFQVLSAMHPLSDNFKEALKKNMTMLSLPKHHMLLEAPKVSEHAYFLDNGFVMSYSFVNGKKQVEHFWQRGQIIVSAKSFFERIPSVEFIQLMQQSDVLYISHESVLKLFASHEEANFIYRVVMNQYYELGRERIRDLQHMNAVQRYNKLINSFPHIEQVIPSEYVASYLGMVPQSLSRVKREIGRT